MDDTDTTSARTRLKFPRPDLGRIQATRVALHCLLDPTDELETIFSGPLSDGPGTTIVAEGLHLVDIVQDVYSRRKQRHVFAVMIGRFTVGELRKISVLIRYGTVGRGRRARTSPNRRRESELLGAIRQLPDSVEWRCSVAFELDAKEPQDLWFPLPTRVGGDDQESALYEIRGVEAVRFSEGDATQPEFSFILRSAGKKTTLDIDFTLVGRFEDEMVGRALRLAAGISNDLIPS